MCYRNVRASATKRAGSDQHEHVKRVGMKYSHSSLAYILIRKIDPKFLYLFIYYLCKRKEDDKENWATSLLTTEQADNKHTGTCCLCIQYKCTMCAKTYTQSAKNIFKWGNHTIV